MGSDAEGAQPRYGVDRTPGEITFDVVDDLWREAIDRSTPIEAVHARVEALVIEVNAQSPVVNWAMTDLHALTRAGAASSNEELSTQRDKRAREFGEYERDPQTWMRDYFLTMIEAHTARCGIESGRTFAARLVRSNQIDDRDLPPPLRASAEGPPEVSS